MDERPSAFATLALPAPAPSEYTTLRQTASPPSRESDKYLQIVENNAERVVFNPTVNDPKPVQTKEVTLSGLVVRFASGGALVRRFSGRSDLARLTVCADEIVIAAPLKFPGTTVTLFARRLRFEGDGSIDTTPASVTIRSDRPTSRQGAPAGAIHLNARELDAPGRTKRLIAIGGNGQPAMLGKKGADGTPVDPWNGKLSVTTPWTGVEELDWSKELKSLPSPYEDHTGVQVGATEYYHPGGALGSDVPGSTTVTHGTEWPGNGASPKTPPGTPAGRQYRSIQIGTTPPEAPGPAAAPPMSGATGTGSAGLPHGSMSKSPS